MTVAEQILQEAGKAFFDPTDCTEDEYQDYIDKWIGIPWVLNGTSKDVGLDCRTLAASFLRGQGINVKDTDNQPLPETIDELQLKRFEQGVKEAGTDVPITDLKRNDLVYYRNKAGRLHIGVWLGYNKMLTTDERVGSIIVRMKPQHLSGAIRGDGGVWLDMPPGHDPVSATVALVTAVGTAVTAGVATGTAALVIGAVTIAATAAYIGFGIGAVGKPSFDFDNAQSLSSSPRYSFDGARNIRSNQYPVALIYGAGPIRILQTFEIWTSGYGGDTQKRLVVVGEGELGSVSDVELNGDPIANFTGSSATTYVGSTSQSVDSRAAASGIVGLKNTAYIALTLTANDKLGGDPVVTCTVTGRKIKTWGGASWSGSTTSGNPAAIIRDYLTLSRTRGGCGFDESRIDDASFGEVYDFCAASVDNGSGGTEARALLDIKIDSYRPWLDNLQDMLSTFGGYLVTDGRKFYLRAEKNDASVQSFTDDDIVDGSLTYQTFSKDQRPNKVVGTYVDTSSAGNDARTVVSVDDLTDQTTNPRGVVERKVNLLGIQRQSQCIREITKILNDARTNWYTIQFETDIRAIAVEPGDVITVTHPILGDGSTGYKFRVFRIYESGEHRAKIIAKAFTSGVFSDTLEQAPVTLDYTPPPNPFDPVDDVTNAASQAVGFFQKDGAYVSNLLVTWTAPDERMNLKHYIVETNKDSEGYKESVNVFPTQTSVTIPYVKIDSSYAVRIKTVNRYDVQSDGVVIAALTIDGDAAAPSDVGGFQLTQVGDELQLTWDHVSDIDFDSYEIKEGGTDWDSAAVVISKYKGNKYVITAFGSGTKTYRIKAIDRSGNVSVNAASDSATVTSPSNSNVIFSWDLFSGSLNNGTFATDCIREMTTDYNAGYFRPTIALNTTNNWDNYASTWTALETDLDWDDPGYKLAEVNYTSEEVDIGSSQTATVSIDFKNYVPDGSVTIEWAYDTSPSPSSFAAFASGVYTLRYFKFKIKVDTNAATDAVRNYKMNLTIDVKDQEDQGSNVAVVAAGTVITFNKSFSQTPETIVVTTVGTSAYFPIITTQSNTSFTVKLSDTGGTFQNGNVNWYAKGF